MKKLLALCCLALLLMGCEKKFPTEAAFKDITFDFTLNFPDDADPGKTGWTAGDRAFVIFQNTNAFCVSLLYDGSAWKASVISPFGRDRMSTGPRFAMALYRPLITEESLAVSGHAIGIPSEDYSYYLASEPVACYWDMLPGGKVRLSATMDLHCPTREYVQFFVKDDTDGAKYTLRSACFEEPSTFVYLGDLTVGSGFDDREMKGFPCEYGGERGYLFCGEFHRVLDGAYLILTEHWSGKRWDYFLPDHGVFNSREVVHLPAPGEGSGWQEMTPDGTVKMQVGTKDLGTWHICNYGAETPSGLGTHVTYAEAAANDVPTREETELLFKGCKRTLAKIGEQEGVVFQSDTGFLFFPSVPYWTSSSSDIPGLFWSFYFYYGDAQFCHSDPEEKNLFRRVVR